MLSVVKCTSCEHPYELQNRFIKAPCPNCGRFHKLCNVPADSEDLLHDPDYIEYKLFLAFKKLKINKKRIEKWP